MTHIILTHEISCFFSCYTQSTSLLGEACPRTKTSVSGTRQCRI